MTTFPSTELHLPGTPQAWVRRLVFSPPLGAEVEGRLVGDADGLWIGCDVGLNVVGFAEGDELGLDVTGEELGLAVTGDELGLPVVGLPVGWWFVAKNDVGKMNCKTSLCENTS